MVQMVRKLFVDPLQTVRIIETDKPSKLPELSDDLRNGLRALPANPAFQYLLSKLKLQRAMLKSQLETNRHSKLENAEFLQSGIYWSGWLEAQLHKDTQIQDTRVERIASSQEQDAFNELHSTVEFIS